MRALLVWLAAASATPLDVNPPAWLAASTTALDEYVSRPDANYGWFDTGHRITGLAGGGVAHVLNVTSQAWLDTSRAAGPNGNLWSHTVAIIVPERLRMTNVSTAVLTGGENRLPVKPPDASEEYLALGSLVAAKTGTIVAVVYQLPNCPIVYPSDPEKSPRIEDAMIAWAWRQYIESGNRTRGDAHGSRRCLC